MKLVTKRCLIRKIRMEDTADLHEILSDTEVMQYIEPVFDMEQTKKFIQDAGLNDKPLVYAVVWKETEKVIGHVIFHPYGKSDYEIGWILNKTFWGMGIADELTKALLQQAGNLGAESCVIECAAEQMASKKIAIKNGFQYEEKTDGLERYCLRIRR